MRLARNIDEIEGLLESLEDGAFDLQGVAEYLIIILGDMEDTGVGMDVIRLAADEIAGQMDEVLDRVDIIRTEMFAAVKARPESTNVETVNVGGGE